MKMMVAKWHVLQEPATGHRDAFFSSQDVLHTIIMITFDLFTLFSTRRYVATIDDPPLSTSFITLTI